MHENSNMTKALTALVTLATALLLSGAGNVPRGLNPAAEQELRDAGVDKYVGQFTPALSEDAGNGWTRHTFDPDGGNGPICIAGTPFNTYTRPGLESKLLIFFDGGGACWQDFYFCSILADDNAPADSGIAAPEFDTGTEVIRNPFADWSVVFLSYCDGSTFTGDNDVVDPNFPLGPVRFHRGLRNATAGIDLAKAMFPNAGRIMVAGSSAGGVGAAAFAPFLTRMAYGNNKKVTVFNDAGPVAINLAATGDIAARAADWQFGQFFPASCTICDDMGQTTEIIKWRLENDNTIRESFYSTDGDATNRFFMKVPTQVQYRDLITSVHGEVNTLYPDRYKRFIRSGDDSHTALGNPLFYVGEANGVPVYEWTDDFVVPRPTWIDIVEDFVPVP